MYACLRLVVVIPALPAEGRLILYNHHRFDMNFKIKSGDYFSYVWMLCLIISHLHLTALFQNQHASRCYYFYLPL
jgi:hypothetical protein